MDAQQSTNHTDTGQDGPPSDGGDLQSDSRVETPPDWAPAHVDISVASIARIYDYFLGGKDNYPADREVGRQVVELLPWLPATARANRRFLVRAVSVLAKAGIGQFLDLGTGIPTSPNVHEVAQRFAPDARVVYVDNDPLVLVHARALMADEGRSGHPRTVVVAADVRDPAAILADPKVRAHLDLTQPVAVLMLAVLHFLTDADDPGAVVGAFREVMAPGSHLVLSHATPGPPELVDAMRRAVGVYADTAPAPVVPRTPEQIARLFDGFDLLDPGLVPVNAWGARRRDHRPTLEPGPGPGGQDRVLHGLAGVGRLASSRPAASSPASCRPAGPGDVPR